MKITNNLYIPLKNRSVIEISGSDSKKFMQGLITNDINKVDENSAIYALMLTPQGKFLYDFFIAEKEGILLVDCNKEDLPNIIKKLKMYRLRSDVVIEDASEKYEVASLVGAKVFEVIEGKDSSVRQFCKGVAFLDSRVSDMYARSFIEIDNNYQSFEAFDFKKGTMYDYEDIRINAGVPKGSLDMVSQQSFPHEFGMDKLNAIDYNKGCYVGQEVTARVHHKSKARKGLYVVEADSDGWGFPEMGTDVKIGDEKIGTLLSSTANIALAILMQEKVEKNNFTCNVNEMELKVRS